MSEQQINVLTQRLNCLEHEMCQYQQANRWWKSAAILLLSVIGTVVLVGLGFPNRVIEAEKFVLRDTDGKIRAILGAAAPDTESPANVKELIVSYDTYGLHLYWADGRYMASFGETLNQSAVLSLHDKDTPSRTDLRVGAGIASLDLSATEQKRDAAERENTEWIRKYNTAKTSEEKERLMLTKPFHGVSARFAAFPRGTSLLELTRGSALISQGIRFNMYKGQSTLLLTDEEGNHAVLGYTELEKKATRVVEKRPASSLVLLDKNSNVIWKAP